MTPVSPVGLYLAQLPPAAAVRAQSVLARAAAFLGGGGAPTTTLPWHALAPEQAAALRLWATFSLAVVQANALLTALRGVLRWAARSGQIDGEDANAVERVLGRVRSGAVASLRVGRPIAGRSLQALIDVCESDSTPLGRRDAALLALLAGSGLTPAQAARLEWRDWDRERGLLLVRTGCRSGRALLIWGTRAERLLSIWAAVAESRDGPAPAGVAAVARRRARQAGLGRLCASDLAASYRWEIGRSASRDPLRPACSLLGLDDGTVLLATPCLDPTPSAVWAARVGPANAATKS
jgi:integrase